jgi:predicted RecB family nuclease
MRAQAVKHAGKPGIPTIEEVDAFLASDIWVDLYEVLTTQLVWPTMDHTLKTLAKEVSYAWRDDDPSGSNSVVWYQGAINLENPEHEALRERILEYNEDDNRATAWLLNWLQKLEAVRTLGRKIARVEDLELRYQRRR